MNKTTLSIRSGLVILLAVSLAAFTECSRKGDREKLAGGVLLVNYLDHLLDKILGDRDRNGAARIYEEAVVVLILGDRCDLCKAQ